MLHGELEAVEAFLRIGAFSESGTARGANSQIDAPCLSVKRPVASALRPIVGARAGIRGGTGHRHARPLERADLAQASQDMLFDKRSLEVFEKTFAGMKD